MKRYYYYIDQDGMKCRVILTYEETNEENCDICNSIKHFLQHITQRQNRMRGLATGSLARHLATGKHWKQIARSVTNGNRETSIIDIYT